MVDRGFEGGICCVKGYTVWGREREGSVVRDQGSVCPEFGGDEAEEVVVRGEAG